MLVYACVLDVRLLLLLVTDPHGHGQLARTAAPRVIRCGRCHWIGRRRIAASRQRNGYNARALTADGSVVSAPAHIGTSYTVILIRVIAEGIHYLYALAITSEGDDG